MMSFFDYVSSNMKVEIPQGNISGEWFSRNGLPMVVRCSCCDMTMASPSAWIDEDGDVYCGLCANRVED